MPDRVTDVALLGSLSVISVLMISFFNSTNTGWGVTTPRWLGIVSNLCFSVGWYTEFAAVVVILVSFANAYLYKTPFQVLVPLLFTTTGIMLYIVQQIFAGYTLYYKTSRDQSLDAAELPPADLRLAFFLCENIPLYICALFVLLYTSISCFLGRRRTRLDECEGTPPRHSPRTWASRAAIRRAGP